MNAQAKIRQVIACPATSYWLNSALQSALPRDVVRAANDAELLVVSQFEIPPR